MTDEQFEQLLKKLDNIELAIVKIIIVMTGLMNTRQAANANRALKRAVDEINAARKG
jgi:hypothetical protein